MAKSKSKRNMASFTKKVVEEPPREVVLVFEEILLERKSDVVLELEDYLNLEDIILKCEAWEEEDDLAEFFIKNEVEIQLIKYLQGCENELFPTVALEIICSTSLGTERIIPDIINYHLSVIFSPSKMKDIGGNFRLLSLITTLQQTYDIGLVEDLLRFLLANNSEIMITLIHLFLHLPPIQELIIKSIYGESDEFKKEKEIVVREVVMMLLDEEQCYQAASFLERLIQFEELDQILKSEETSKDLFEKMLEKHKTYAFEAGFQFFSFLLTQPGYPKFIVSCVERLAPILQEKKGYTMESYYGKQESPLGLDRIAIIDFLLAIVSTVDDYEEVFIELKVVTTLYALCCEYDNSNVLHSICLKIFRKLSEKGNVSLIDELKSCLKAHDEIINPQLTIYNEKFTDVVGQ